MSSTELAALPVPGRSYASTLGFVNAPALPGGAQGPFTSWYPNGAIESHGHYLDFGARSVPDGLWGFWYSTGQRRTFGAYHRGAPAGCFAVWDEDGTRHTGVVEGEQLRVEPCVPPPEDELLDVEGHGPARVARPGLGDISLQGFVGPGGIGARNAGQIDRDPALAAAFNLTARLRIGRLRIGPTFGLRSSDNASYRGFATGAVVAVGLPSLHPRLDADVGLELGAQYLTITAMRPNQLGTSDLRFWSPLGAVQLGIAFRLTPNLHALAAARVDGGPDRDVDRDVTYCAAGGCFAPVRETWQLGGFAYGASLGLRLQID